METALRFGWFLAGITALILLASLAGDGTGPFGLTWLRHPFWSYILVVGGALLILSLTPPRKQNQEA